MGQLIEIIFEDLNYEQAKGVIRDIIDERIPYDKSFDSINLNNKPALFEILVGEIGLNSGISVSNVHIRLLKYEKTKYDIEVNFDLDDVKFKGFGGLEVAMHNYAKKISDRNHVKSYYSGLEPAKDLDTRFFTCDTIGPFKLPT